MQGLVCPTIWGTTAPPTSPPILYAYDDQAINTVYITGTIPAYGHIKRSNMNLESFFGNVVCLMFSSC